MENRIIYCMKWLQAPNLKTIVLIKAMYTAIHSYDEQAFDNMSEESEKNTLSLSIRCGLFQVETWLSRPKKHGGYTPQRGYLGYASRPQR